MIYKLIEVNGSVCIDLANPRKEHYLFLSRLLKNGGVHWSSKSHYVVDYKNKPITVTFHKGQNIVRRPSKDPKKSDRFDVYLVAQSFDEGSQGTCYLSPCNYHFENGKLKYRNFSLLQQRLVKYTSYALNAEEADEAAKLIQTKEEWEKLEERNKQKVKESFAKEFIFAHKVDAYSPEYGLHVKKPVDIGTGMLMSMRKKTGESLFDLINRDIKAPCLTFLERLMLAIDFVLAARVCNQAGVLHRDIKTENIIVEPSVGFGKLCDYGLSTDLNQPDTNIAGSLPYLAPEFWTSSNCRSSEATDLYSMGRVLFLLFRGSTDSYNIQGNELNAETYKIVRTINFDSLFSGIPEIEDDERILIRTMLEDLLSINPENRPSAEECYYTLKPLLNERLCKIKIEKAVKPHTSLGKQKLFSGKTPKHSAGRLKDNSSNHSPGESLRKKDSTCKSFFQRTIGKVIKSNSKGTKESSKQARLSIK